MKKGLLNGGAAWVAWVVMGLLLGGLGGGWPAWGAAKVGPVYYTPWSYAWLSNATSAATAIAALGTVANANGAATNLTVRGGTAWRLTNGMAGLVANTNLTVASPYTNAVGYVQSGTANFGQTGGETNAHYFLDGHQMLVNRDGTLEEARFYVASTNGLTGFYLRGWRRDGTVFDHAWTTTNLVTRLTVGTNTLSLNVPGLKQTQAPQLTLEWSGGASVYNLYATGAVAAVTNYAIVNGTLGTNNVDWRAQTATVGSVPVIELKIRAAVMAEEGDSTAVGTRVATGNRLDHNSFAEATYRDAIDDEPAGLIAKQFGWSYVNLAVGGSYLTTLSNRLDVLIDQKPRVAILAIGRNDVTGATTATQYTNYWNHILTRLTTNNIVPVVQLMFGGDDLSDGNDVVTDTWNENLVTLANAAFTNAILVNVKPYVMTNAPDRTVTTNLYNTAPGMSDDGIHLSHTGVRRQVQAVVDAITPAWNVTETVNSDYILAGNGKSYAPSWSFKYSPLTGFMLSASNQMSVVVNAGRKWDWDASGHFLAAINGAVNIGAAGGNSPGYIYAATQLVGPVGTNLAPPFSFLGYRSWGQMVEESGPYLTTVVGASPVMRFDTNGNWLFPVDGGGNVGGSGTDRPGYVSIKDRLKLGAIAGDVAVPVDGDIWRDDTGGRFRGKIGGVVHTFASSASQQGSGSVVFSTSPTIATPTFTGDVTMQSTGNLLWGSEGAGGIGATSANRPSFGSFKNYLALGASAAEPAFTNDRQFGYNNAKLKFRKRENGSTIINLEDSGLTTVTQSAGAVAVDLTLNSVFTVALGANATITTSNRTAGKAIRMRFVADGSGPYTFTWPAWVWPQGAPASIAASKMLTLEVYWAGTAETDAVALYFVTP